MDETMAMDLDSNQTPSLGIETSHSSIEDRIRHLEAVMARARQRQRWREARNDPELSYGNDQLLNLTPINKEGNCKRDITQLAKALEVDEDKEGGEEIGGFFDCNICLDTARDPILTCCGHLFCWVCFYQLSYVDSSAKECPVCKGEVTDSGVTPIYGNGNGKETTVWELESGVRVPPRPHARRVESVRQQSESHHHRGFGDGGDSPRLVGNLETYINYRSLRRAGRAIDREMDLMGGGVGLERRGVEMNQPSSSSSEGSGGARRALVLGGMFRELRRRRPR